MQDMCRLQVYIYEKRPANGYIYTKRDLQTGQRIFFCTYTPFWHVYEYTCTKRDLQTRRFVSFCMYTILLTCTRRERFEKSPVNERFHCLFSYVYVSFWHVHENIYTETCKRNLFYTSKYIHTRTRTHAHTYITSRILTFGHKQVGRHV